MCLLLYSLISGKWKLPESQLSLCVASETKLSGIERPCIGDVRVTS